MMSRNLISLCVVALASLTACEEDGVGGREEPATAVPVGGKADGWGDGATDGQAPAWLLSPLGHDTWSEPGSPSVVRAWVDARVQNRRLDKRVFVEVAAPYEEGPWMRLLYPAQYRGDLGDGYERWGTDAIEMWPEGGPHGHALAGAILYRLRMQEDPDHDGHDQIVVTSWAPLYGEPSAEIVEMDASDPWRGGWRSPARAEGLAEGLMETPKVLFAPFDDPGRAVIEEIDAIIAAQQADPEGRHTLHAAIFNINDPRITDRLIAAHEAGVEVRLITEGSKLRPAAYWQTEDDRLLAAGVPLLGVRRGGRAAMHDKFALFDGRRLATGSFNWEHGSSFENHENMLLTDAPDLVRAYARRFEALAGQVQGPRIDANDPEALRSVSFAPDAQPHVIMGQLIDSARETILTAMFTCKDVEYVENGRYTSVFRKLGEAVDRGVAVTVITDYGIAEAAEYFGRISEDDPMDEWLESLGVHVVRADNTMGRYASMHHKFSVIDAEIVITGAFNWYYDAAFLNDEDQLVWRDPTLAAEYTGEIADLLRRYDDSYRAEQWPQVTFHFAVEHRGTQLGDTVYVVGDLPELGAWSPAAGLALDGTDWPIWRGEIKLPAGVRMTFKPVTRQGNGRVLWRQGPDLRLRVPTDRDEHTIQIAY